METNAIESIADNYRHQISEHDALRTELTRKDKALSRLRGVVFLVFLAFALASWDGPARLLTSVAAVVAFIGFVAVVAYHEKLRDRLATVSAERLLTYRRLARYERDWSKLPDDAPPVDEQFVATARDLDLVGRASVYQWLSRAHTPRGRTELRDWLFSLPTCEEIADRQVAVRELVDQADLRNELDLHGFLLAASNTGPEALVEWASGPVLYEHRTTLRWAIRLLTVATMALPVLLVLQLIPTVGWLLFFCLIAVNILVNAVFVGSIHDLFNQITAGRNELFHYQSLFDLVDQLPGNGSKPGGGKLESLRAKLNHGNVSYRTAIEQLARIMNLANGRRSSTFGIPYVIIQVLTYWDFHILVWLERWQKRCGSAVSEWFDAVAELETLSSLAAMAADHPDWTFPTVDVAEECYFAEELGHPLLSNDGRQRNSVTLGPTGSFLLVTGSNMSGKSTMLRTIGVNAVLAQAGAPVCANGLRMPLVELATSMRVTDSLDDGVSFFLAELQRLKSIVDQSRVVDAGTGVKLLYLLDEILQGTNSAERQIAVAKVLSHLVKQQAIGAISTHDLELADESTLKDCGQTVHFREHFVDSDGKREMKFDYQLREGVSPTTNALKLLELVGLGD